MLRVHRLQPHADLEWRRRAILREGVAPAAAAAGECLDRGRAGAGELEVARPGEAAGRVAPRVAKVVAEGGLNDEIKQWKSHLALESNRASELTFAMASSSLLASSTLSDSLLASSLALALSSAALFLASSSALLASASRASLSSRSALSLSSLSRSLSFLFASRLCFCTRRSRSLFSFSLILSRILCLHSVLQLSTS